MYIIYIFFLPVFVCWQVKPIFFLLQTDLGWWISPEHGCDCILVRCGFCIIERSFPYPAGLLVSLPFVRATIACTTVSPFSSIGRRTKMFHYQSWAKAPLTNMAAQPFHPPTTTTNQSHSKMCTVSHPPPMVVPCEYLYSYITAYTHKYICIIFFVYFVCNDL